MALTMLQAVSFATGGLEWLSGTSPGASSATPISPETYYWSQDNIVGDVSTANVTSGSNWIVFGTHVRFNDITNDGSYEFLKISLTGGSTLKFSITSTGGDVTVYDVNGSSIATMSGKVSVNTWYRVSGIFKQADSTALKIWMTEASNLENGTADIDTTGVDLYGSGSGADVGLTFSNNSNPAYSINVLRGTSYLATAPAADAIGDNNPLRQFWSKLARPNNTTGTPDVTGGDVLSGSTTWDMADEVPKSATNKAKYSITSAAKEGIVTCDDATNGGPLGNSDVGDGIIWWNGWAFWYRTSNLTTGKGIYPSWYGNYGAHATATSDGTTNTINRQNTTAAGTLLTAVQLPGDTYFADKTKYMQHGFGATGSPDIPGDAEQVDCLAAYLYEEPAASGRLLTINGICQTIT